jgi:hypothetical protein
MIFFKAKPAATTPAPVTQPTTVDNSSPVDATAVAKRKKSDTDGTGRRQRKTVDDNRLL